MVLCCLLVVIVCMWFYCSVMGLVLLFSWMVIVLRCSCRLRVLVWCSSGFVMVVLVRVLCLVVMVRW